MRKRQWTCRSIHTMFLERGFTLSYPSVCNHVRRISATMGTRPQKEVYVRREHDPGQECEFDRGEIPLVIGGRRQMVQMAVFTLLHSNRRSAWLFRRQDTLSLKRRRRRLRRMKPQCHQRTFSENRQFRARCSPHRSNKVSRNILQRCSEHSRHIAGDKGGTQNTQSERQCPQDKPLAAYHADDILQPLCSLRLAVL